MNIFIHGLGQTSSAWDKALDGFDKDNIRCPNLALLTENTQCTYQNLYKRFCEYCNSYSKPLSLCGLSLGAVLALNYALDFPENTGALILIAPQYKMPKALLKFQNAVFRFMPSKQFLETGFAKSDFISLCGSMAELDLSGGLENINCPVLILCGDKDKANIRSARSLNEKLSNSQLEVIENCGHEVNLQSPERLAEYISRQFDIKSTPHKDCAVLF